MKLVGFAEPLDQYTPPNIARRRGSAGLALEHGNASKLVVHTLSGVEERRRHAERELVDSAAR